tara:strand:- start:767 stop:1033 length:267 start_codon:yes stop_codon:yes gene_type:complete
MSTLEYDTKESETITWINIDQNWEWYYFVPLLNRNEWDGIEYDSVQYGWDELDYRFGVDYPAIPESSMLSLTFGIIAFMCIAFKKIFK